MPQLSLIHICPCWLDIPLNVQGAFVETEELSGFDAADYEAGGNGWAGKDGGHGIPEDLSLIHI